MSLTRLWGSVWLHLDGVKGGLLSRSGRSGGALFCRSLFLSLNLPIHVPHELCQDDIQVLFVPQPARSDSIWHATQDALHEAHTQCQSSRLAKCEGHARGKQAAGQFEPEVWVLFKRSSLVLLLLGHPVILLLQSFELEVVFMYLKLAGPEV